VIVVPSNWRDRLRRDYRVDRPLVQWVRSRPKASFYDLWDETIDPVWLPHLAKAGGATKKQLVFAHCAVARLCLHLVPEGEERPRIAIETAEAWTRGKTTYKKVVMAKKDSWAALNYLSNCPEVAAAAQAAATGIYSVYYHSVHYTLQAGIGSQIICATLRKHLPFERPRLKGLTIWQRLAIEEP